MCPWSSVADYAIPMMLSIIVLYRIHSTFPPHDWQSSSGGPRPAGPPAVRLQLSAVSPQTIGGPGFSPATYQPSKKSSPLPWGEGVQRCWTGEGVFLDLEFAILNSRRLPPHAGFLLRSGGLCTPALLATRH